jgi:hypothetical protein
MVRAIISSPSNNNGRALSRITLAAYTTYDTYSYLAHACRDSRRRQGYSSIVLRAVVAFMTSRGLMVSLLLGVPNYYHQFGYVSVGVQHVVVAKASTIRERLLLAPPPPAAAATAAQAQAQGSSGGGSGLSIDDAVEADIGAMCALYEQENASRSGTLVRPLQLFAFRLNSWLRARGTSALKSPPPGDGGETSEATAVGRMVIVGGERVGKLSYVSEDELSGRVRYLPDPATEPPAGGGGGGGSAPPPEDEWEESALLPAADFVSMEATPRWSVVREEGEEGEATGRVIGYFCWVPPLKLRNSAFSRRSGGMAAAMDWSQVRVWQ